MKNFVSYKGRSLNFGDYVEVYRNLRNHKFSVRVNGLVVGYVDEIKLENVLTKVGKSGRERVLLEKKRMFTLSFVVQLLRKLILNIKH